ncbi:MAG: HAD-IC family P-type ATPase, partial [Methanoregula sp.]
MTHASQPEQQDPPQPFHSISEEELYSVLGSSPGGLTSAQAQAGLARLGPNDISRIRKPPVIFQYLGHFKNLLVIILLIAAAISLSVGEITNAAIIVIIVLASVTLNFFQEYKAGNAAELLKQKLVSRATAFRDGMRTELPVTDLVPGDVVFLTAGDIVPADARVLDERDFFVNQSALTGEPFPVGKTAGREDPAKPLAEAGNYIFLGTSVVSGTATALVTRTGMATEFGHVAKTLIARPPETEFERGLKQFSYLMSKIIFFLVIFVFFINALFRHGVLESLLFSIALAVGMTPELLPMILSLNLSTGS